MIVCLRRIHIPTLLYLCYSPSSTVLNHYKTLLGPPLLICIYLPCSVEYQWASNSVECTPSTYKLSVLCVGIRKGWTLKFAQKCRIACIFHNLPLQSSRWVNYGACATDDFVKQFGEQLTPRCFLHRRVNFALYPYFTEFTFPHLMKLTLAPFSVILFESLLSMCLHLLSPHFSKILF